MSKSKKKGTEDDITREDLHGRQAENLFPDLFPKAPEKQEVKPAMSPPPPPAHWDDNDDPDSRGDDDASYALVLLRNADQQALAVESLTRMDYVPVCASTAVKGIEELRRAPFQVVLCGADATFARFRDHLTKIVPIQRRRRIFYALVGPHLHTCYNMEALAMSANLVINEQDLPALGGILHKGFRAYEKLYKNYLELLEAHERVVALSGPEGHGVRPS